MGKEIDLVRYRNDGDDFHVLWTARRALRMLDRGSGLVAVAVEGASEREQASGEPLEPGLLVIDTTEYYGSEDMTQATQVVYNQLKYSTTAPDKPWTVVGLKGTLEGFAHRFTALCGENGQAALSAKVRFRFVSNRPISAPVQKAFAAAVAGTPVAKLDRRTQAARKNLLKATGLKVTGFDKFAAQVDLWGNQEPLDAQERALAIDSGRYAVFLDSDASKRMKDLVRGKALSRSANDKTITLDTLLRQFGLGSERELLPAEPKFEELVDPVPRAQEPSIIQKILASRWPVIIRAPGGVGKSILAQRLPIHLPAGSEAIIFDGFAGGDYRNPRLYRHKHSRGLVHIANQLAMHGLCDVLIAQNIAPDQQYLEAFRKRMEQAAAAVRSRSPDAVVLIVIDAADNLGMAAEDAQERSFVPDLLLEEPPTGCHIVALARGHRVEKYLKPVGAVVSIDLEPFNLIESAEHLRKKFVDASENDIQAFHSFTDSNPRVQANALALAEDLPSLREGLGPNIETVEELIAGQLDTALDKVIREQATSRIEIESLCIALAALDPPVPIHVLASAAAISDDAVRSFISDFSNGRPIVISDDTVQFRDEPVETWFHDTFVGAPDQAGRIADLLRPFAAMDAYVAAVLPLLLHRAERYDELVRLALEGDEPEIDDPVEKRAVLLSRVQYALKAALAQNRLGDVAKLLLRAGEEVAANDRQSGFLMDHADLVSSLAGPKVVSDFIFRQRAWEMSDTGYAYCAAMLAADRRNSIEAERFLSLASSWLRDWFINQRARPNDEPWAEQVRMESEDIAAYAEAIRSLRGVAPMIRFMENWQDWAAFEAIRIVVSRLLDRGEVVAVEDLFLAAGDRVVVLLAVILEMNLVCAVPPIKQVRRLITLLDSDNTPIDLKDYPENNEIPLAIAATAEIAVQSGLLGKKILAVLARYPISNEHVYRWFDRGGRREAMFRTAALTAVLQGRRPTLDDVMSTSVREALSTPSGEHKQEVREFREIYGSLIPWYGLRAVAIASRVEDWDGLVATAQKECKTDHWGWAGSSDLGMAVGEIGVVWFEALLWSGRGNDASALEVDKWLTDQKVMITIPTWTGLARRAAYHHASCHDSAMRFAKRAWELIEGNHGDARETADSFAALARSTLSLGQDEATGYFQKALEHLNRLGDELHERLFSVLALARKAARSAHPDSREAYRVARMGELFHAYNDHKFPWHDIITAVTQLCPASGFAITSRWNDRAKESVGGTLPWVVLHLLEGGFIRPSVAAALHAFGGYWQFHKQASLFFDKESELHLKQDILDTLVQDQEFEPNREENAACALLAAAKDHGLESNRLEDLVEFHGRMPDWNSHPARNWADSDQDESPGPDWANLLAGIDMHTPEGVDEAITRRQATKEPSDWQEFLAYMRGAIEPTRRADHVLALAHSQDLMTRMAIDALEACAEHWGDSSGVGMALDKAVKIMAEERAAEMVGSGWGLNEAVRRCANLSRLSSEDVLNRLTRALAGQVEHVSAAALFNITRALAASSLNPEQAKNALAFGLDRLEPVLKDEDGDGVWRHELEPPSELYRAVAGFLYAMLASPEAKMRWRAAHAVRRLCRFGETQIVFALVELLPSEALPAFTDTELPFYSLHARLFLLIALARAAEEAPDHLVAHAREFVRWSLDGAPHVLIRHFAARAALELERNRPGVLDQETVDRLIRVNISPFPSVPEDDGQSTGPSDRSEEMSERFRFDYDFDAYWLEPLANAFNLSKTTVVKRAEAWVVDRWNKPDQSAWDQDARARRGLYGRDTHASHGSYPPIDRYSFYLSYHAMFCTAGDLLSEIPTAIEYGENRWRYWLTGHLLTRSDGKWLADRRDFEPLEARPWELEKEDWERRDEWPFSVLADDFDGALGIDPKATRQLAVWGWWFVKRGGRKETIHVSSALATPRTSLALMRALQTADNPHNYKIPVERERLEIDLPGFQLCGWIVDPDSRICLDQFDPFAGSIPWPGPSPGRRVRRLLKLEAGDDGRVWCSSGVPVMETRIWGDRRDDRYRPAGNHGQRLTAELDFLLKILRYMDRDLIIELEIGRDNDHQKENEISFPYRRYTRVYLLRRNGQLHTLHGYRYLRP